MTQTASGQKEVPGEPAETCNTNVVIHFKMAARESHAIQQDSHGRFLGRRKRREQRREHRGMADTSPWGQEWWKSKRLKK